jgi:hypothetical protein
MKSLFVIHLAVVMLLRSGCQSTGQSSRSPEAPLSTEKKAKAKPYPRRSILLQDQAKPGSSFDQFRQQLRQAGSDSLPNSDRQRKHLLVGN